MTWEKHGLIFLIHQRHAKHRNWGTSSSDDISLASKTSLTVKADEDGLDYRRVSDHILRESTETFPEGSFGLYSLRLMDQTYLTKNKVPLPLQGA